MVAFPFLVRGRSTALWSRDEAVADVRQIQRTIQEVGVDESMNMMSLLII